MEKREIISQVLTRVLMSTRLPHVQNIAEAHENACLSLGFASQLAADNKLKEVIRNAMSELSDDAADFVLRLLK